MVDQGGRRDRCREIHKRNNEGNKCAGRGENGRKNGCRIKDDGVDTGELLGQHDDENGAEHGFVGWRSEELPDCEFDMEFFCRCGGGAV